MLYYILQIVAFQVVFLLVYDVFLKRETFFNYNRVYLLGTAIVSFIIPFIKLDNIKELAPKDFVIVLPEVIIGTPSNVTDLDKQVALQAGITLENPSMPIWQVIFYSGMCLALLFFLFKLFKLFWLASSNPKRWKGNVLIVKLLKSSAAFSFFNTVFLGEKISEIEQPTILKHELVHVKEWHSIDLLVFQVMQILLWFNPLVYMYQNRIKALHEYIADETAVKQSGKISYYQQLLNQVFETNNLSFTNTFFKKSLIKKRIAMLQKSKSKKVALIKYTLLIPLVFTMLIYTSSEVKAQEPQVEEINEVIDIQEIDEKTLIDKYYKQMKAFQKTDNYSKIMQLADFNLNKFRMSLDEYARLKAFTKITFIDRIEEEVKNGTISKSKKEMLKKFKSQDKNYKEYIDRTNTEEYGRQWETRTEDGILKFYAKDLKNKSKSEEERLAKKIDFLTNDPYWKELIMSDGKQTNKMILDDVGTKSKDILVKDVIETIEVPYAVIENVPTFPECKDLSSNNERKKCTSKAVAKFVNKNFNTGLATKLGLEGRQRIAVFFKIDKQGKIASVRSRAPHPALEEEANRVIKLLPQFIPGKQKGKPVTVPYSLPILFQVQGKANDSIKTPIYNKFKDSLQITEVEEIEIDKLANNIEVPYAVIDNAPTFPECKDLSSNEERKKCTSNSVAKFVNKNFNLDLATKLGLEGEQRIFVSFKIDKQGNIATVSSRAPHPALEKEANRVIRLLPQFIPGTQKGKPVVVPYALPIVFQIATIKKEKN